MEHPAQRFSPNGNSSQLTGPCPTSGVNSLGGGACSTWPWGPLSNAGPPWVGPHLMERHAGALSPECRSRHSRLGRALRSAFDKLRRWSVGDVLRNPLTAVTINTGPPASV